MQSELFEKKKEPLDKFSLLLLYNILSLSKYKVEAKNEFI